jgi:ribosome-binding protein aMBF1 (putative translation factor)
MMKARTGAERYFAQRLQDPVYAEAHQRATATVSAIDDLVRALDSAREEQHLSKAELARRVGVDPAAIRRFFSTDAPNPTAQWLVQVALALGYRFSLERDDSAAAGKNTARAERRAAVTA